jgi:hypothetical protein
METLCMSVSERVRLSVFSQVKNGALKVAEAGRKLGLSERQARRIWKGYQERGDAGLVHGLRGRPGNAAQADLRARVLARYRERYAGWNAAHAAEKLATEDLAVPRQTLALAGPSGIGAAAAAGPPASAAPDAQGLRGGDGADGRLHARLVPGSRSGLRLVRDDRRCQRPGVLPVL